MSLNAYNAIARIYDPLASLVFGDQLLKAKQYYLNHLTRRTGILIIGGGTGTILSQLALNNQDTPIYYLEASSSMIELARKKNPSSLKNVCFIHGDESCLSKVPEVDTVITNFFLDQFSMEHNLEIMDNLFKRLQPGGFWLFTDFMPANLRSQYWKHNILIKTMYLFFRLTTNVETQKIPDWDELFTHFSLSMQGEQRFQNHLICSRLYKKEEASR